MIKFKSLHDLGKVFPTEKSCIKYLERHRWNGIITSPFDPNSKIYKCANNWYKCKTTGKRFNAKTGTIFKGTKISLQIWFWALYNLVNRKKGISSHQLHRDTGITQASAWHLLKDLRSNLEQSNFFKGMFKNEIEIDETYLGGKNKNRHWNKKVLNSQGRSWKDKTPVLVIKKRKGNVIAIVVPNVKRRTLEPIIRKYIKKGSSIYTDEWYAYDNLYREFNHQRVIHKKGQYVNGKASTNCAENFNVCLKRGIYGTHHWVSKKYTQVYVDEVVFRYNTRERSNQERFDLVLGSVMNNSYQQLIN